MGLFDIFKKKKKPETIDKYSLGLKKSRKGLLSKLRDLFTGYDEITEDLFDDLTDILIMSDVGVETTLKFIEELKADPRTKKIHDANELQDIIVDKLTEMYSRDNVNPHLIFNENALNVYLFIGVNGSGKTTTIAKVAHRYKKMGKKVLLAAADTFRAGAIDQLDIWAKRIGVDIVTKPDGSDPSSVIFDACKKAKAEKYDILLCDTAGRLQNKTNLMKELEKMNKVIIRETGKSPDETLLVIDATTGQNGLSQASAFKEITDITGIVLTKLDGTSKGGIVLAIKDKYHFPIKLVGLGEKMDDLMDFDIENYLYGLLVELSDE